MKNTTLLILVLLLISTLFITGCTWQQQEQPVICFLSAVFDAPDKNLHVYRIAGVATKAG